MLLKLGEVAELLSVSRMTVRRMQVAGRLPRPVQLGPFVQRWRRSDLEAWIAGGCPVVDQQQDEVCGAGYSTELEAE